MTQSFQSAQRYWFTVCMLQICAIVTAADSVRPQTKGIWTSRDELQMLPTSGPAWEYLTKVAERTNAPPVLSDQNLNSDVEILAKAMVYARTGNETYRRIVVDHCLKAIGTERDGRTLALGRNLTAYVIAADLVTLDTATDKQFRNWLKEVLHEKLKGRSLVSTHEDRPNNWGTHAGAARAAVAIYLNDRAELARTAAVFKGYLGDRSSYASFIYGDDLSWQADAKAPVGINPKGATISGQSVDGAMPDDLRRGAPFQWPPKMTEYPWEALQGALVQAEILYRAGYPTWEWEDQALLRAAKFLYGIGWKPEGDDQWMPWLINHRYGSRFPTSSPARFGKSIGFTDWTHARDGKASEAGP